MTVMAWVVVKVVVGMRDKKKTLRPNFTVDGREEREESPNKARMMFCKQDREIVEVVKRGAKFFLLLVLL